MSPCPMPLRQPNRLDGHGTHTPTEEIKEIVLTKTFPYISRIKILPHDVNEMYESPTEPTTCYSECLSGSHRVILERHPPKICSTVQLCWKKV
ncbi:hypothetical protein AVEN_231394-1 [Araneus ventricosus]|uniref:Uncharacterized protein n=1 Tax=Araneus ventricosus TaxID=182803 RepID=A0A4Y2MV33_ARAVE|nr:hypothetical protein AVEN_231394-1 [Araneus ventricosus]